MAKGSAQSGYVSKHFSQTKKTPCTPKSAGTRCAALSRHARRSGKAVRVRVPRAIENGAVYGRLTTAGRCRVFKSQTQRELREARIVPSLSGDLCEVRVAEARARHTRVPRALNRVDHSSRIVKVVAPKSEGPCSRRDRRSSGPANGRPQDHRRVAERESRRQREGGTD